MDHFLFQVGTRYDLEYFGPYMTLPELPGARRTGTRSGPKGDENEFVVKGRVVVLDSARIVRAEPT